MQLLPNEPADQLVTIPYFQTESRSSSAELRAEMAELRTELRSEMAELRIDFERRFNELDTKFTRLWATTTAANAVAVATALLT